MDTILLILQILILLLLLYIIQKCSQVQKKLESQTGKAKASTGPKPPPDDGTKPD